MENKIIKGEANEAPFFDRKIKPLINKKQDVWDIWLKPTQKTDKEYLLTYELMVTHAFIPNNIAVSFTIIQAFDIQFENPFSFPAKIDNTLAQELFPSFRYLVDELTNYMKRERNKNITWRKMKVPTIPDWEVMKILNLGIIKQNPSYN